MRRFRACTTEFPHIVKFALAAMIALITAAAGNAQTPSDAQQSLPPFGSFSGSDFDTVALQNGNLHISIPLIRVPQRGGRSLSYKFVYDTPAYKIIYTLVGRTWFKAISGPSVFTGWREETPFDWGWSNSTVTLKCNSGASAAAAVG